MPDEEQLAKRAEGPAMTPTPTPILVTRDGEWWDVGRNHDRIARCWEREDAETIAALLRFRDAMTPEMWAEVKSGHEARVMMRPKLDRAIFAALDTLRAALGKS